MGIEAKSNNPFVFHHLSILEDGAMLMKPEGILPEGVRQLPHLQPQA